MKNLLRTRKRSDQIVIKDAGQTVGKIPAPSLHWGMYEYTMAENTHLYANVRTVNLQSRQGNMADKPCTVQYSTFTVHCTLYCTSRFSWQISSYCTVTLQTVPPVLLSVSSTMLEICAISKSLDFFIFQQEDLAKIEGTVSQDFNPVFHDFNPN